MPNSARQRLIFTIELHEASIVIRALYSDESGRVASAKRSQRVPVELREGGVDVRTMMDEVDALHRRATLVVQQGHLW
jgi:hypothetical protein